MGIYNNGNRLGNAYLTLIQNKIITEIGSTEYSIEFDSNGRPIYKKKVGSQEIDVYLLDNTTINVSFANNNFTEGNSTVLGYLGNGQIVFVKYQSKIYNLIYYNNLTAKFAYVDVVNNEATLSILNVVWNENNYKFITATFTNKTLSGGGSGSTYTAGEGIDISEGVISLSDDILDLIPATASSSNPLVTRDDIGEVSDDVTQIKTVIPSSASSINKLATNSQINTINSLIPEGTTNANRLVNKNQLAVKSVVFYGEGVIGFDDKELIRGLYVKNLPSMFDYIVAKEEQRTFNFYNR